MSSYLFENIYIPAAQADNTGYLLLFVHGMLTAWMYFMDFHECSEWQIYKCC